MKKELKKLTALLLAGVLLAGCGTKKQDTTEQEKPDEGSSNQTEEVQEDADGLTDSDEAEDKKNVEEKAEEVFA